MYRLFDVCYVHVINRLGLPPISSSTTTTFTTTATSSSSKQDQSKIVEYKPFRRHNVPFIEVVSSTLVRSLNPYPYWPLPIQNTLLTNLLDSEVYEYIKRKGLYNFSSQYLWKQRIFRGSFIGIMIYLCFFYHSKHSIV